MAQSLDELVQHQVELQPLNTLGLPAKARLFASVESVEQLQQILRGTEMEEDEIFVLGGGSNILLANNFDGLVLQMDIKGRELVKETEKHVWLRIGGGENWHESVRYTVEKGWGGIENLSLIPGRAGAAPIQNIGAYGVELMDVFEELEAVEIATAQTRTFQKEECEFGYRESIFKGPLKGKYAVTHVTLKLDKKPSINFSYGAIQSELEKRGIKSPTIRDISDIVIDIRNSKLPNPETLGNAGSFFKNPIIDTKEYERLQQYFPKMPGYTVGDKATKVPAGWLIEEVGWKGKVLGNTGTYKQQALVIVNHGGATAGEILELARKIQQSVKEKFEIELVPEVNIID